MTKIRVAITGAYGKMGSEAVKSVRAAADMELVAGIVRMRKDTNSIEIPFYTDTRTCLFETKPDVLVDLTHAETAKQNVAICTELGVRPVIGSTGFTPEDLQEFDQLLRQAELGGLYAPNFSLGALLMIRAATLIAPFFQNLEIIEYHHEAKKDAPSGTARKTAETIAAALKESVENKLNIVHPGKFEEVAGIPIHSVRLPGYIAHQEVVFGGLGEHLSIRHDTMSRESFMPGVLLGIRNVVHARGLVNGLEHFLF